MGDYLLGLATLPALAFVYFVLYGMLYLGPYERPYASTCPYCDRYACRSARFEPWATWALRRKIRWRWHMRKSPGCLAQVEKWQARREAAYARLHGES